MTKLSDSWQTPQWLFDELSREHGPFDIDLCATRENSKCDKYCLDYLESKVLVEGEQLGTYLDFHIKYGSVKTAFMNPPYSNPKPFIEKAWEDSKHCKIVCLVKCDPSTRWWATFWNYTEVDKPCSNCRGTGRNCFASPCMMCYETGVYPDKIGPKPGCDVRFLPKRVQFDPPQQFIDSGEVWKVGNKWVQLCMICIHYEHIGDHAMVCNNCKGKGFTALSGPTFPSAVVIMDRRGI